MQRGVGQDIPVEDLIFGADGVGIGGDDDAGAAAGEQQPGFGLSAEQQAAAAAALAGQQMEEDWEEEGAAELLESAASVDALASAATALDAVRASDEGGDACLDETLQQLRQEQDAQ
jgi:hypothetical protein